MKKITSVVAALLITFGTVVSAAGFGEVSDFTKITEPDTLTPTGGVLIEEGEITVTGQRSAIRRLTSGSQQTFEEYLRAQLINHAQTINVARFRIPVSEFSDKYFAFIFCNSDLPIHAAYERGSYFTENGVHYMQSIAPVYVYETKEECDRKYTELDNLTTSLAEYASKGKTELEKALFLFDKISLDYYYTPGTTFERINHTPYSFIDYGHGVCQGYAILYKLVLDKLNIESCVCSNTDKAVNHAWNSIKIDGKWYHADPTWSYYADEPFMVSRKYFLLSDTAMLSDSKHGEAADWDRWYPDYSSISCTSNDFAKGYLFRDFPGDPIYRDSSSLYFSTTINNTFDLTIRNDSLKSPVAVMSEPDSNYKVHILTLNAVNTPSCVIFAYYGAGGNMLSCSKLNANALPAQTLIPLPEHTPVADTAKFKCMLVSAGSLNPIAYYSEAEITK